MYTPHAHTHTYTHIHILSLLLSILNPTPTIYTYTNEQGDVCDWAPKRVKVGTQNLTIFSIMEIDMNFLPSIHSLISNILQLTEHKYISYRTQDIEFLMMTCSLCQLGPFLLAQSHAYFNIQKPGTAKCFTMYNH